MTNGSTFTPEEEDEFLALSRDPSVYERIVRSIAPSIYGSESMLCYLNITHLLTNRRHQARHCLPAVRRLHQDVRCSQ